MHSIDTLVPPSNDNSTNVEVETSLDMVNKITAKLEETTNALHDVADSLVNNNDDSDEVKDNNDLESEDK